MPDRFGDLRARPGRPPREDADEHARSPAEELAELDRADLEREEATPAGPPARPGGRYAWVVGVAFLIVILVVAINSLPNAGRGFRGPAAGRLLPAFAAPSATGARDEVANVKQGRGDSDAGNDTPACEVRGADVVNICDIRRARPVTVTFMVPGVAGCEAQLDRVERTRREFPQVSFVAVVSGKRRKEVESLVRENDWGFPVAVDRDLAVFNLYRLADCPATVFARRGGRVTRTARGPLSEAELRTALRDLVGTTGQRGS